MLFTAKVTSNNGEAIPSGESVTIHVGSTSCIATTNGSGSASCSIGNSALGNGTYSVSATYAGDSNITGVDVDQLAELHLRSQARHHDAELVHHLGRGLPRLPGGRHRWSGHLEHRGDPATRRDVQRVERTDDRHAGVGFRWHLRRHDHRDERIRQYEPDLHASRDRSLERKGRIVEHIPIICSTIRIRPTGRAEEFNSTGLKSSARPVPS